MYVSPWVLHDSPGGTLPFCEGRWGRFLYELQDLICKWNETERQAIVSMRNSQNAWDKLAHSIFRSAKWFASCPQQRSILTHDSPSLPGSLPKCTCIASSFPKRYGPNSERNMPTVHVDTWKYIKGTRILQKEKTSWEVTQSARPNQYSQGGNLLYHKDPRTDHGWVCADCQYHSVLTWLTQWACVQYKMRIKFYVQAIYLHSNLFRIRRRKHALQIYQFFFFIICFLGGQKHWLEDLTRCWSLSNLRVLLESLNQFVDIRFIAIFFYKLCIVI